MAGFYQTPNDYADHIMTLGLSGVDWSVLAALERLTWGWRVERVEVSFGTLAETIKRDPKAVKRSVQRLVQLGLVSLHRQGGHRGRSSVLSIAWPPPPNVKVGAVRSVQPKQTRKGGETPPLSEEKVGSKCPVKGGQAPPLSGGQNAPLSSPQTVDETGSGTTLNTRKDMKYSTPLTPQRGDGGIDKELRVLERVVSQDLEEVAPGAKDRRRGRKLIRRYVLQAKTYPPKMLHQALKSARSAVLLEIEEDRIGKWPADKRLFELANQNLVRLNAEVPA